MPKPSAHSDTPQTSWLVRSVTRLFRRAGHTSTPVKKPAPHASPFALSKDAAAQLPPFAGLPPERIHVPHTEEECAAAAREILAAGVAGFDTEARPTFNAGEKSTGPHVVQFALTDCAYIFQLRRPECERVAADLIASEAVLKVGFGLNNDHGQIRARLRVTLHAVPDLDQVFRRRGHRGQIGVRGALAATLRQSFTKSKKTTTSNWAAATLTDRQLAYAANDAYAALKVLEALHLSPEEIARFRHSSSRSPKTRPAPKGRRAPKQS